MHETNSRNARHPSNTLLQAVARSVQGRAARMIGVAAMLVILLAGCTVYVVPGDRAVQGRISISLDLDQVITTFQPTRGPGATYRLGEQIEFAIRTNESGYVSLTAIDPDGSVYTFARNIWVEAGRTTMLPSRGSRVAFVADPPTGLHRVRASFTRDRVDTTRVRFEGRSGEEGWTTALRVELRDASVRDVVETYLFIERR